MALSQLFMVTFSCVFLLPDARKSLVLAQNSAHDYQQPVGLGPKAAARCGYNTEERTLLGGSYQELLRNEMWFPIPKPPHPHRSQAISLW